MLVRSVQRGLAGVQIRLRGFDNLGTLEDFPEEVEAEEDGDADVGGDKVVHVEGGAPAVEAVEDDNEGEVDESGIGGVWLPRRLEDQGVAVDALSFEGGVEADVGNADTGPGEETGDGGEALEPLEGHVGAGRAAQVRQEGDRSGDADTPIRNTPAAMLDAILFAIML